MLDGTFMYWTLGALPLAPGTAWRLGTWMLLPDAAEVRETPVLEVVRTEEVVAGEARFDAWVVEARLEQGSNTIWVTDRPPYLLRQEVTDPDGTVTPVITLVRLRSNEGRSQSESVEGSRGCGTSARGSRRPH